MASPASDPANQTSKIAGTLASSQVRVKGRPLNKTNTTGLPVASNAFNSFCCAEDKFKFVTDALSPVLSAPSPKAATITSASALIATASSNNCSGVRPSLGISLPNMVNLFSNSQSSSKLDPLAYFTLPEVPTASVKPFNKVIDFVLSAPTLQVPVIFSLALAKGPTNAIVLFFAIGKILLLFFNNTKLCAAIVLASALLASLNTSAADLFSSQYL